MNKPLSAVPLLLMLVLASLCCEAAPDAGALIEQGDRQAEAGDLDAALQSYRLAIEADPASSLAHTRLGGVQMIRQEYPDSISSFRTAIGLAPDNAAAFIGMGLAYLHLGQYSLSRAALMEARQRSPERGDEIDQLLAWLGNRASAPESAGQPLPEIQQP